VLNAWWMHLHDKCGVSTLSLALIFRHEDESDIVAGYVACPIPTVILTASGRSGLGKLFHVILLRLITYVSCPCNSHDKENLFCNVQCKLSKSLVHPPWAGSSEWLMAVMWTLVTTYWCCISMHNNHLKLYSYIVAVQCLL